MATRLEHVARAVALVAAQGHRCCLVGGLAVGLHARERFTKDIDFAVAVASDQEAEAVAGAFVRAGFAATHLLEQTDRNLIATVRFALPGGNGRPELDLLFHCCGIEAEIVAAAEPVSVGTGVPIPVARVGHLIAMKVLAESEARATDRSDLVALFAVASPAELRRAETAIDRIAALGFARGKDLRATFETFRARHRG